MFSVTNLLYSFFNKMSNGIYPEQSIDDYNKEKREELNILDEERKVNIIIDNQLLKLKEEKLITVKNNLKLHIKIINNINTKKNEPNFTIITRIYYILYNLIKDETFFDSNNELYETNKKLYKLEHYINGLTYTSPFDNEEIILDRLIQLCDYLSLYFPNNSILKEYVEADISHIPLSSIIKKIINL